MSSSKNTSTWLTLAQVAKALPTRPNICTVWRWCTKGAPARDGERVFLGHVKLGRRIVVAQASLHQFMEELSQHNAAPAASTPPQHPLGEKPRSHAQRERALQQADEVLQRAGIGTQRGAS